MASRSAAEIFESPHRRHNLLRFQALGRHHRRQQQQGRTRENQAETPSSAFTPIHLFPILPSSQYCSTTREWTPKRSRAVLRPSRRRHVDGEIFPPLNRPFRLLPLAT